jgi:hypothetical protein
MKILDSIKAFFQKPAMVFIRKTEYGAWLALDGETKILLMDKRRKQVHLTLQIIGLIIWDGEEEAARIIYRDGNMMISTKYQFGIPPIPYDGVECALEAFEEFGEAWLRYKDL